MSVKEKSTRNRATRESVLLLILLLIGLLILPIVIYSVGTSIFGEYAGDGFWDFFSLLHHELLAGEPVVWFLVFSPYLIWQIFRVTIWAFQRPRSPN
jgi:hypothetical protein